MPSPVVFFLTLGHIKVIKRFALDPPDGCDMLTSLVLPPTLASVAAPHRQTFRSMPRVITTPLDTAIFFGISARNTISQLAGETVRSQWIAMTGEAPSGFLSWSGALAFVVKAIAGSAWMNVNNWAKDKVVQPALVRAQIDDWENKFMPIWTGATPPQCEVSAVVPGYMYSALQLPPAIVKLKKPIYQTGRGIKVYLDDNCSDLPFRYQHTPLVGKELSTFGVNAVYECRAACLLSESLDKKAPPKCVGWHLALSPEGGQDKWQAMTCTLFSALYNGTAEETGPHFSGVLAKPLLRDGAVPSLAATTAEHALVRHKWAAMAMLSEPDWRKEAASAFVEGSSEHKLPALQAQDTLPTLTIEPSNQYTIPLLATGVGLLGTLLIMLMIYFIRKSLRAAKRPKSITPVTVNTA